jgi:hypothetical protein
MFLFIREMFFLIVCVAYIISAPVPKEYEDTLKTFEFIGICLKSWVLYYVYGNIEIEV